MDMYIVRLIFYFRSFELNNWWMATFHPKPGSFAAYCLVLWGAGGGGVRVHFLPRGTRIHFFFLSVGGGLGLCLLLLRMYEAARGQ